ncbi:MotA/TolQ/ExbB proton channel family protein [Shewanella gelidii]|uniref:Flagellar motor protein MotA n=1 Tax=Shewanella gelidii TaxID=1642821 RepID=A0A917JN37_9GAMM|nr:MotA/TolQ/ExbB proton channel family protein [Shewanella gelidii]MCL1099201.1 MotA/TolQ/ExbB proton channel family protein [Shewanella gelidii]GGI76381.1 flagellar motor protein MotA [Shewanella gelidii]
MSFTDHIIAFLQNGGPFIYPIALVLVVGLAITIERWLYLSAAHRTNLKAFDLIKDALKTGDLETILKHAQTHKAPVFDVLKSGIARTQHANRREDIEYAMEETIMEYMLRLEKRTPFIATLANIATLLGLLGTIMGLIAAFSAVASADPAEKANLLSSSISVAMNTTAFGLITAIPLILFHSGLQTKTATIVDSIEMVGIKLLNSLSFKKNSDVSRGE